jgi:anthranilate synthase component 2
MKILVLDNYDSFTYNLVQILDDLGLRGQTDVIRNDKISVSEAGAYDRVLLSPGPGIPEDAGIMPELIRVHGASKSILGICLGHQAIAEAYGAELFNMPVVLHGIPSEVNVMGRNERLFNGLSDSFRVCHYHSWAVVPETVNSNLEVTAMDTYGHIMGLRHTEYDVKGLQFHPESILTEHGHQIIKNWLEI